MHYIDSYRKQFIFENNVNYPIIKTQKNLTEVFSLIGKNSPLSTHNNRSKLSPNSKHHIWLCYLLLVIYSFFPDFENGFPYVVLSKYFSCYKKQPKMAEHYLGKEILYPSDQELTLVTNKDSLKKMWTLVPQK